MATLINSMRLKGRDALAAEAGVSKGHLTFCVHGLRKPGEALDSFLAERGIICPLGRYTAKKHQRRK